jgi:hypothetical protein
MAVSRLSQTTLQNAFQKFNNVWDGVSAVPGMDALGVQSFSTSTGTSAVYFANIPQTYQHLQLRCFTRQGVGSGTGGGELRMYFAGDGGNNYSWHMIEGAGGGTPTSSGSSSTSGARIGLSPGNASPANIYSVTIVDILDYTNTSKNTAMKSFSVYDFNTASPATGVTDFTSSMWYNTAAITYLQVNDVQSAGFAAGSTLALYGIK